MEITKVLISVKNIVDVYAFVNAMNSCKYDAEIRKNQWVIDPRSCMGMFSLNWDTPAELVIKASAEDCADVLEEIKDYIVK